MSGTLSPSAWASATIAGVTVSSTSSQINACPSGSHFFNGLKLAPKIGSSSDINRFGTASS